jgi:hypothetical protein
MRRLGDSPIKRPFGYFLGASKKLPAQQSGKKAGNTKRLNGTKEEINPSLALPLEEIRGGKKSLRLLEERERI